ACSPGVLARACPGSLCALARGLPPPPPGCPRGPPGVLNCPPRFVPNPPLGSPVLASSEYSLPSFEPKTICGAVCASPGQYSTPRVDGFPDGSLKIQSSLPVVGSSATTREYGVAMNIVPPATSGV